MNREAAWAKAHPTKRLLFSCLLFILALCATASGAERIHLLADMLINLSGQRPAVELIDEQDLAGDPRDGTAAQPKTSYSNGWMNAGLYYPLAIVVDLGVDHDISDICFYDVHDRAQLTVDARDGDIWKTLLTDGLIRYQQWARHTVDVTTRYLRVTFESPSAQIAELLVYGTAVGKRLPEPEPEPVRHEQPLMDAFIGINGFVDDPIERIAACGTLREYHNWQWDEGNNDPSYAGYPDHQLAWSPSWVSGPGWGWDFDAFYQQLKDAGVEVAPCIQKCALYVVDFDPNRVEEKPISAGNDPTRPQSYVEHASYLFQFAARYGSTVVDEALLKLKDDQPRRSGLGLVRYIENWNEPDKWWKGRAAYFSPFELAAMCSADCDGHRGAMGRTVGVKNADPNMKFVLGGLAIPELEYIRAMQLWADFHRDGDFPADVLNFHHYSNDAGGQSGRPTAGISPEADGLRERFQRIVEFRNRYLPGKEIWVSEFGYDTNPKSVQRAPAIGSASAEEVQGQWIVRSYLALAAAGVDRAQQYMLRDVNAGSTVKFNSSGLTSEKWNRHQPKRSWFYVATLRHVLGKTRFEREIPSGDDCVRIYRFRSADPACRYVDAVWCPTSNQEQVKDFPLNVATSSPATLVTLQPDSPTGQQTKLTPNHGCVTLTVTERPAFVVAR